jgi:uncharacterized membrane protein
MKLSRLINTDLVLGLLADSVSLYIPVMILSLLLTQLITTTKILKPEPTTMTEVIVMYFCATILYAIIMAKSPEDMQEITERGEKLRLFLQKTF